MSKLKTFGIVSLLLLLLASIGIISWYVYIKFGAEKVIVADTYYVGLQTVADGTETKHFVEVNYLSNDSGNGISLFEIKFNYLMDENQNELFSQGLQYTEEKSVAFIDHARLTKTVYSHKNFFGWETVKYHFIDTRPCEYSVQRYNYMSYDDYKTTLISTNPINNDSFFRIQIGDKLYGMKFKGEVPIMADYVEFNQGFGHTHSYKAFVNYDVDYFAASLFDSVQSLENGTKSACVFEFGDLFDYYEYDEDLKRYSSEPVVKEQAELIATDIKSYYSILVNKNKSGAKQASDSLFNSINGSPTFNLVDIETEDYFYGKTTLTLDNAVDSAELAYVKISDKYVALKIKDSFNSAYLPYVNDIELKILINLDLIKAEGLEFVGFTLDSGLQNYKIISCQTVETVNGELVYSGVAYA